MSTASSTHLFDGIKGSGKPSRQAGFVSLKMDPSVWILPASSPAKHVPLVDVPTKLKAAVADSLCHLFVKLTCAAGNDREMSKVCWESMLTIWLVVEILSFRKLCNGFGLNFEFGTWEQSRFRFRGRELCQDYNRKSIRIPMSKSVQEMEPVGVPKHVKDDLDAPLEASVHSQFRGGVGQLQWLQLQGNPLLPFATGILQSRSATPNGHDLLSLNKLMREAKSMPDLYWWMVSVPSSFVWLTAADAASANRLD